MIEKLNIAMDNLECCLDRPSTFERFQLVQNEVDSVEKKLRGVVFFLKQLRTLRIHQKQPDEVLEALIKDID